MKPIFNTLKNPCSHSIVQLSFLMILILAPFQYLASNRMDLSPFFVFPVLINSWYGTRKAGLFIVFSCVLMLVTIEIHTEKTTPNTTDLFLFAAPKLVAYSLLALLVTNFRDLLRTQTTLSETDSLTGVHNTRSFYAKITSELSRSKRCNQAFSLAYIDIDNFKHINDSLGHSGGDEVLVEVAKCLVSSLRDTDIVARLGGDEYICLLPETNQRGARSAFTKTSFLLKQRMKQRKWPVSFSIGVVTFNRSPANADHAIHIADQLMYSVKKHSKNNIVYKAFS